MLNKLKLIFQPSRQKQILQKLGFSSDSEGILNRYYREEGNWDSHLKNTKNFIIESAQNKEKGTAVVLGSGWLLDVPLIELSELFKKVYLIDIVHSKQTKHKVSKLTNVEIIEYDISGGALEAVLDLVAKYKSNEAKLLTNIQLNNTNFGLAAEVQIDFVVSVNILSQLDYFALEFLRKNTAFSSKSLSDLKEKIQSAHLSFLPKGKTCLITDFKENIYNETNRVIRENFLLKVKIDDKLIVKKWKWQFDTHKTYYKDGNTFMNVMALNW